MRVTYDALEGSATLDAYGSVKQRMQTAGGGCDLELVAMAGSTGPAVHDHHIVFDRSRGSHGDWGEPTQHVHVANGGFRIEIDGQWSLPDGRHEFPRGRAATEQSFHALLPLGDGKLLGVRDAMLRDCVAIVVSGGRVTVELLGIEPATGFAEWVGPWQSSLNGSPGEDPLSVSHHTLPGGRCRHPFHVLIVDDNDEGRAAIDCEPMPDPSSDAVDFAALFTDAADYRPPRLKSIIDSMADDGPNSLLAYAIMGEARFGTWDADPAKPYDLSPAGKHLGPTSWPGPWWNDGHTMLHHGLAFEVARIWMETRSPATWWLASRYLEFSCTAALFWNDGTADGLRRGAEGFGAQAYEKSLRGGRSEYPGAYAGYPFARYKQNTRNQMMARLLMGDSPWIDEGAGAHLEWLEKGSGYDTWDGKYGARIAGDGLINIVDAYRVTKNPLWSRYAIDTAMNVIKVCKQPARLALEVEDRHKNPKLGLPYIANPAASNPPNIANVFGNMKVVEGLIRTFIHCSDAANGPELPLIADKIQQMGEFAIEEWLRETGGVLVNDYLMTPDRVPAVYNNGTMFANTGARTSGYRGVNAPDPNQVQAYVDDVNAGSIDQMAFSRPWFASVLVWMAYAHNHAVAKRYLKLLWDDYGEFLDYVPQARHDFWEGYVVAQDGDTITLSFEGDYDLSKIPSHCTIRVAGWDDESDVESDIIVTRVSAHTATTIVGGHLGDVDRVGHRWFIGGPIAQGVKSWKDRAVRVEEVVGHNGPDPARPFDWMSGQHFNAWFKVLTQATMHGPLIAYGVKSLVANGAMADPRK